MARAATKKPGTEIVDWEKQMEEQAKLAAAAQRSAGSGGKFFSMRAGQLAFDGNQMPGNQMAVVILGWIMENSYYDTAFDPDTPASPKCFAFAQNEEDLEPHEAVDKEDYFERQNDVCDGCPMNEFGSARTGKGKACANVVRLAMIPAGFYKALGGRNAGYELELFDDEEHFRKAEVAYMKLPVMSVRNWSRYVKDLASTLHRPPQGVITNLYLTPDDKSQFKVNFEVVDKLPSDLLGVVMPRHQKEMDTIGFPYTPPMEREEPKVNKANSKLTKGRRK